MNPTGRAPYGFRRRYSEETGRLAAVEFSEDWPVVVEVFEAVADGTTPLEVAGELNAREQPSPGGGVWREWQVRRMIGNDAYTGHHGWPRLVEHDVAARARRALGYG